MLRCREQICIRHGFPGSGLREARRLQIRPSQVWHDWGCPRHRGFLAPWRLGLDLGRQRRERRRRRPERGRRTERWEDRRRTGGRVGQGREGAATSGVPQLTRAPTKKHVDLQTSDRVKVHSDGFVADSRGSTCAFLRAGAGYELTQGTLPYKYKYSTSWLTARVILGIIY